MVWKPRFGAARPEPFSTYEGRVARLYRGNSEVGLMLVQVDDLAYQLSGHLWWKRFAASEPFFVVWTVVDGRSSNDWLVPTDLTAVAVKDWAEGRHEYYAEMLRLAWVPPAEAERLARSAFGHIDRKR